MIEELSPSNSDEVHVLAVDDSNVDRKIIESLLKISSCKVTAVDSGRRALQFLGLDEEKKTPVGFDGLKVDLIITDYCMPGMTGYDLLKKIKGSSSLRDIPVVIMSSEKILARIDRCLEEGAEDFIVKPVKLSDVKRLKNYMFGEDRVGRADDHKVINKRKSEPSDLSSSPSVPSPYPSSCSSSQPTSPSSSLLRQHPSEPSPLLPSPPPPPSEALPPPPPPPPPPVCSPTSLNSPTRRLNMGNSD